MMVFRLKQKGRTFLFHFCVCTWKENEDGEDLHLRCQFLGQSQEPEAGTEDVPSAGRPCESRDVRGPWDTTAVVEGPGCPPVTL